MKFVVYLILGLILRLMLLAYGAWQDANMDVKYTDVDYKVCCDAAQFIYQGTSPYERDTYRYTPLLAWMLIPNIYLGDIFGKLLFTAFDLATGVLLHIVSSQWKIPLKPETISAACLWFLNPFSANICTRGNAESIMTFLTLLTVFLLQRHDVLLSSVCFALSVHFKIYPITYSLPIYFLLDFSKPIESTCATISPGSAMTLFKPTWLRFKFVSGFLATVILLTHTFYKLYGWAFIQHTYLYHITRSDIRHNFSPYFYLLYLTPSRLVSIAVFLPQVAVLVLLSLRYYHDTVFVCFLHTFVFVTLNKVCTSQYFLWYMCYIPLLLPHLEMTTCKKLFLPTLWFAGQGFWLMPAYLLEFKGQNTFLFVWVAGLALFVINVYILTQIISCYKNIKHHEKVH